VGKHISGNIIGSVLAQSIVFEGPEASSTDRSPHMSDHHQTQFDPTTQLLTTGLHGTVHDDDVEAWIDDLTRTLDALPDQSTFALLLDLHTYEPGSIAAHKAMRTVIPDALARHGMRPAYIDLFDPQPDVLVEQQPRARCIAFANVHHNVDRMEHYEERAGKPDQRFFSDLPTARQWIGAFG
jgi:hypothetical protein